VTSSNQRDSAGELFGDPNELANLDVDLKNPLANAATEMFSYPWVRGVLSPKERALILLCLDASASQLEPSRLPQRISDARAEGATDREIVTVLHLTSLMACHSMSVGGLILSDVLLERGETSASGALNAEQEEAVRRFEEDGPVPRTMSDRLRTVMMLDPEHFNSMQTYISKAYAATDVVSVRFAHLVCLAFDVAPTHLYEAGIRIHIKEALDHGATTSEILEVFQLASLRGWRSVAAGLNVLNSQAQASE